MMQGYFDIHAVKPIMHVDFATGDDMSCRTYFKKLPNGAFEVTKVEYWNRKKECWE